MPDYYAKVIVLQGTFEDYRQALLPLVGPGIDLGLIQVGVHEALLRPHLLRQLVANNPGQTASQLLEAAGAQRIDWLTETQAFALCQQRIPEDLEPRPEQPVPDAVGGRGWHLQAIDAPTAWGQIGTPGAIDWQNVRVGQLDTGYTQHRALGFGQAGGSWLLTPLCRTFMDSHLPMELAPPVATADDGIDLMPSSGLFRGHGTRVAATISGHAPDAAPGFTYLGVAPRVPLVMVRISDSVSINDRQDEFAQGLRYLVDVARVDVVNVSLGVYPPVAAPAMKAALDYAHANGVIVVCAAGNVLDPVVVPARLPQAIAVAGSTWQSLPWHGSSFGPEVAFSAPGAAMFRPDPQPGGIGTAFSDGGDGTSYAAGVTTGTAALWLRRWGAQITARYGRTAQRVEAFRTAAIASCRHPSGWAPQPFGAGILNAGRLCTDSALALP